MINRVKLWWKLLCTEQKGVRNFNHFRQSIVSSYEKHIEHIQVNYRDVAFPKELFLNIFVPLFIVLSDSIESVIRQIRNISITVVTRHRTLRQFFIN